MKDENTKDISMINDNNSDENDVDEEEYFRTRNELSHKAFNNFWSLLIASIIIAILFIHPNIFKVSVEMFDWVYIDGNLHFK